MSNTFSLAFSDGAECIFASIKRVKGFTISALNPEDYLVRTLCHRNAAPEADIIGIRWIWPARKGSARHLKNCRTLMEGIIAGCIQ